MLFVFADTNMSKCIANHFIVCRGIFIFLPELSMSALYVN